jgi:hypothetical protein
MLPFRNKSFTELKGGQPKVSCEAATDHTSDTTGYIHDAQSDGHEGTDSFSSH